MNDKRPNEVNKEKRPNKEIKFGKRKSEQSHRNRGLLGNKLKSVPVYQKAFMNK